MKNSDNLEQKGLPVLIQVHGTILQQLRIHKNICQLWGYAQLFASISAQRGKVSVCLDKLIMRVLYAEQNFDVPSMNKLNIGQTVEEIFVSDRYIAQECCDISLDIILMGIRDITYRQVLEEISALQNSYVYFLSQQIELVRQMGTQNYLATRC